MLNAKHIKGKLVEIILCMNLIEVPLSQHWLCTWYVLLKGILIPSICLRKCVGFKTTITSINRGSVRPHTGFRQKQLSLFRQFSTQATHVLMVYNVLSIHGWSEVKPAEKCCGNPPWAITYIFLVFIFCTWVQRHSVQWLEGRETKLSALETYPPTSQGYALPIKNYKSDLVHKGLR